MCSSDLLPIRLESILGGLGAEVLLDHEGHLEGDGMLKLAEIQAGQLADLLQAVHQGIAVDEELTGGLGHIQVVLEELVDGEQSLLIAKR